MITTSQIAPSLPKPDTGDHITSDMIFLAKGFAIILVVFGHYGPAFWWPAWYDKSIYVIYLFHMPLFILLSGYLAAWSLRRHASPDTPFNYKEYAKKRLIKLGLPYLFLQCIYIFIKVATNFFFPYEPVTPRQLLAIFIEPINAPGQVLWFIYILLLISLLFPLVRRLLRYDLLLLLLLAIALYFVKLPLLFSLDRLPDMFLFYTLGYLAFEHKIIPRFAKQAGAICIGALLLFIGCTLTLRPFLFSNYLLLMAIKMLAGVAGVTASVAFFYYWRQKHTSSWPLLQKLGKSSPIIYYFHQPIAWIIAIFLYKFMHFTGNQLIYGLPIALVSALAIPILLDQYLIQRNALTAFLLGRPLRT